MKKTLILTIAFALVAGIAVAQKDDTAGTRIGDPYPYVPSGVGICSEPDLSIPDDDPAGVSDTINVPDSYTIDDVDVSANITHTFLGDLIITVEHNGTTVTVFNQTCGGENDMDATFDDESGAIVCAEPLVGSFAPDPGPLSSFDGMDVNGDWTMNVSDNFGADTGIWNEWCLIGTPIPVELMEFQID